jgi:hypothetical protein
MTWAGCGPDRSGAAKDKDRLQLDYVTLNPAWDGHHLPYATDAVVVGPSVDHDVHTPRHGRHHESRPRCSPPPVREREGAAPDSSGGSWLDRLGQRSTRRRAVRLPAACVLSPRMTRHRCAARGWSGASGERAILGDQGDARGRPCEDRAHQGCRPGIQPGQAASTRSRTRAPDGATSSIRRSVASGWGTRPVDVYCSRWPEAGTFAMPTETTCRRLVQQTLIAIEHCAGAQEWGSRSNPVNGSRIVTFEASPSVCAAAEIVWIRSSVRFPKICSVLSGSRYSAYTVAKCSLPTFM